jgi:hypothetical protein
MKFAMRWILRLLLFVFGSGACLAQGTNSGDIRGTVTDPSGASIPGVTVTVLNVDTGVSKDFSTNQVGLYDTSSIVAGNYKITFTKAGFEELIRGPITLDVGFTTVDARLKIGSATVQVTVNTDVPLLQTESGDMTTTLASKTMAQLPQVTQDWENFMILLPGTTGTPGAGQGSSNPGQEVSSNGNLPYANILADGASTTQAHSQNALPAVFETVAELQVSLSTFSAQYGIGGMIMNQITKGGTSSFHGAAYDYVQNNAFNANSYGFVSSPSVPFLRYHNFGGAVGGPIKVLGLGKKAFFFFDYDQIVNHGAASNSTSSVPSVAEMGGTFTGENLIYDPTTQTIAYDSKGNPYPVRQSFLSEYGSNSIPSALIDTVSKKMEAFYPTPTSHIAGGKFVPGSVGSEGEPQNNFYSSLPQSTPYRKYFGRLDYDVTPNNRVTASDTQGDTPVIYPNSVTACPIGCQSGDVDNNNAQITDVWNISSHTINEARMGFSDQLNFFADLALGNGYAAKLGWQFAKADDFPAIQYTRNYPYSWIDPSSNAVYKQFTYDPSDVVTMIRGKHILHFGGELLVYQNNSTAWGNTDAGAVQFSGQYTENWTLNSSGVASADGSTGLEYADFLLGLAQNWSASVSPEFGARFKTPQLFVQDDWKVHRNLTVNLGLRYQISHGWNEVKNNMDSFDPTVLNPATNTKGAFWFAETHANGRTQLMANEFNALQPRVGASWSMNPKTTVRGGFGLYSYTWSLDTYGNGMGGAISSSGNASDQTNGINPITKLDGPGTIYGTSAPLPYVQAAITPTAYNGQAVGFNQYHTPVPRILQWNFDVQHSLSTDFVADLSYVASHGSGLNFPTDINAVPESALSSSDTSNCGNGSSTGCAEPYPIYLGINGSTNNAVSNYNSLQASITKRMRQGVSFSFNYVWSHFLDDQDSAGWGGHGGPQPIQKQNDPAANYSNSNFDVRNAFKGYVVYQLPFGEGKMFVNNNSILDAIIGGWQISGTTVIFSGQPFTVIASTSNTYQSAGSAFPNWNPGVSAKPAHRTARCAAGSGPGVGCLNEWYNPAAFLEPANGTFGNVRRNSLYGPGLSYVNLSVGKSFSLPWEGIKFAIRCDAQNAFNHASFGEPNGNLGGAAGVGQPYSYSANTNQITGTTVGGRSVQLGGRLSF